MTTNSEGMKSLKLAYSPRLAFPNILEMMAFRMSTRVTATVVCSTLIQILCVVSQKKPSRLLCPPNNPVRSTFHRKETHSVDRHTRFCSVQLYIYIHLY